jgi:restriction system protein
MNMGRRRRSLAGDLIALAALLPWWAAVAIAVASHFALHELASIDPPAASRTSDLGVTVWYAGAITFGRIGQWVIPGILAVGALLSAVRTVQAWRLVRAAAANAGRPLTWREFETLVGEIYRRQGYRISETPEGADGGVDLVLRRGDELFLVQCKHWQARLVDVKVVRELKGVVAARGAVGGAVVTSGEFTRDAVVFAEEARIDLIDGARLQALSRGLVPHADAPSVAETAIPIATRSSVPDCPRCGAAMVLRTARRGKSSGRRFWGCSGYPKCAGTRPGAE